MKITKRKIELLVLATVVLVLVALPIIANTGSYPLAIVDGDSMYPNLQNGDMVYYHSTSKTAIIPNGTVIVFVQGNAGDSLFSGLVRPVVIHRVVGYIVQNDGQINYQTKGDNNDVNDPFLTRADHVLGVQGQNIPKIGLLLLFIKSPQGLIATIGIISLTYLSIYDLKRRRDNSKGKLLGSLAKKVLNGYLSEEQFKKLELAIKYSDDMEETGYKDRNISALVTWLKSGVLDEKWRLKMVCCPKCFHIAVGVEAPKVSSVIICSNCNSVNTWKTNLDIGLENLNSVLSGSIDEALGALGENTKKVLYSSLDHDFSLKKKDILQHLDEFSVAMEKIFGKATGNVNLLLVKTFKKNLLFVCHVEVSDYQFQEYVKQVKVSLEAMEKQGKNIQDEPVTILDCPPPLTEHSSSYQPNNKKNKI
jgi:signal peptidase I